MKFFLPTATAAMLFCALPVAITCRAQKPTAAAPGAAAVVPAAVKAAEAAIDAEKIRAHVRFLADDLLEGRGPGLRGGDLAAKYMATQFALAGLKPGRDDGSYLQQVNLVGVKTQAEGTTFSLVAKGGAAMDLKLDDDYVVSNQTLSTSATLDTSAVFVGYGITAPEYNWDDYAGVDVRDKVVLVIVGDPPSDDPKFFGGKALTYYGRWTYKYEEAARRGAVGALIIHRTDLASYPWSVVEHSWGSEKSYLQDDANPALEAAAWIQHGVADRIFAAAGMGTTDAEIDAAGKRGFKAVELPVRLRAHIESTVRAYQSPNVIGILRRFDLTKAMKQAYEAKHPHQFWDGVFIDDDQAVLYTAHYDHLGFVPGMEGDNIYNGAADNATGCGILLELARTWASVAAAGRAGLPHTVIFASVTAEEQNLLGSEYLGQHPPVPAGQIALDLNFDDVQPFGDPLQVTVGGAERTSFYPAVQATAKRFGMAIVGDPHPESGHYYRSDHFSLARVGVPAFSINEGTLYKGHDAAWGLAKEDDYVAHRYHNFSDNYTPDMDFTGDAKIARFAMELGWEALTAPGTVAWRAGDEFEAARKRSLAAQGPAH